MLIADGNGNFIETSVSTESANINSSNSSTIQVIKATPTPQSKKNSLGGLLWVLVIIIFGIIVVKYFLQKK